MEANLARWRWFPGDQFVYFGIKVDQNIFADYGGHDQISVSSEFL